MVKKNLCIVDDDTELTKIFCRCNLLVKMPLSRTSFVTSDTNSRYFRSSSLKRKMLRIRLHLNTVCVFISLNDLEIGVRT